MQIVDTDVLIIGGGIAGLRAAIEVVRKGKNDRKPVGMLFAGSQGAAIANPIDAVLNEFGVTIIGD